MINLSASNQGMQTLSFLNEIHSMTLINIVNKLKKTVRKSDIFISISYFRSFISQSFN